MHSNPGSFSFSSVCLRTSVLRNVFRHAFDYPYSTITSMLQVSEPRPSGRIMINLDEGARRFTFESEAATAFLEFRRRADRFTIVHTVVPPELEGQGVGSRLVTAAVGYAASHGLTVVPICPFARAWLRSHSDVAATVNIDWPTTDPGA